MFIFARSFLISLLLSDRYTPNRDRVAGNRIYLCFLFNPGLGLFRSCTSTQHNTTHTQLTRLCCFQLVHTTEFQNKSKLSSYLVDRSPVCHKPPITMATIALDELNLLHPPVQGLPLKKGFPPVQVRDGQSLFCPFSTSWLGLAFFFASGDVFC